MLLIEAPDAALMRAVAQLEQLVRRRPGGELLGGLWVLLVSVAALRTGGLPRVLNWLGVAIGAAGVISVVPALNDVAYGFGLLEIVWFVWLGVTMLRTTARQAAPAGVTVTTPAPAAASSTARPSSPQPSRIPA